MKNTLIATVLMGALALTLPVAALETEKDTAHTDRTITVHTDAAEERTPSREESERYENEKPVRGESRLDRDYRHQQEAESRESAEPEVIIHGF